MSNKVIIEDLVSQFNGSGEDELKPDQTIRFEVDDKRYSIKIVEKGISIYKVDNSSSQLIVIPLGSNRIDIL